MNKGQEEELRSFIVDSNLEEAFLSQLNSKANKPFFKKWLS